MKLLSRQNGQGMTEYIIIIALIAIAAIVTYQYFDQASGVTSDTASNGDTTTGAAITTGAMKRDTSNKVE